MFDPGVNRPCVSTDMNLILIRVQHISIFQPSFWDGCQIHVAEE